jgi:Ca2+-binding RTX toxin-like protein
MTDIYGTPLGELIIGTSDGDTILGLGGNDTLFGGLSFVGSGSDFIDGGDGDDLIEMLTNIQTGWVGNRVFGDDTLNGGAGNDRIRVGSGWLDTSGYFGPVVVNRAIATGGDGADTFALTSTDSWGLNFNLSQTSRVTDFNAAQGDKLTLGIGYDSFSAPLPYNQNDSGHFQGKPILFVGEIAGFVPTLNAALPTAGFGAAITITTSRDVANNRTWLMVDINYNAILDISDILISFDGAPIIRALDFEVNSILSSFQAGTAGGDVLTGTAAADRLFGLEGNDTLDGLAGNDTIDGGAGNDSLIGGMGLDSLVGGAGADTIIGGFDNDIIKGDGDNDVVYADNGNDTVEGGDGADTLVGGLDADYLSGGNGNDYVLGDGGNDILGNWTRGFASSLEEGDDIFDGGAGNDQLYGGGGNDQLIGGDGDDDLEGSRGGSPRIIPYDTSGLDTLNGGAGNDWIRVSTAGAGPISGAIAQYRTVATGGTGADIFGLYQTRLLSLALDVSTVSLITDFEIGVDKLEAPDWRFGTNGSYSTPVGFLNGGAISGPLQMNMILSSELGTDVMQVVTYTDSNAGITWLVVDADLSFTLSLQDIVVAISGAPTITAVDFLPGSFAPFQIGTSANDTLVGTSNDDRMYGYGGNDWMSGEAGRDNLSGGGGNDTLFGGLDTDKLDGGDGDDSLDGGDGDDTLFGGVGVDTLIGGAGADTLYGNDGNDSLSGGDNYDALYGGTGNDVLDGGNFIDFLFGEAGNDTIIGGDGNDNLIGGLGNDSLLGGDGNDTLYGSGRIDTGGRFQLGIETLDGGAGNDFLVGGLGFNYLFGRDGDDEIAAELGRNFVDGGAGSDLIAIGAADTRGNGYAQVTGGAGRDLFYILPNQYGPVNLELNQQSYITDFTQNGPEADKITFDFESSEQISSPFYFAGEWVGGSFRLGSALPFEIGNGLLQMVTLRDTVQNMTWLIMDIDRSNTFSVTDSVIGFQGAPILTSLDFAEFQLVLGVQFGTNANDTFIGNPHGVNRLVGLGGNDSLVGGDSVDIILGGDGSDTIAGLEARDFLYGDAGNDYISGGQGDDILRGGVGNDTIFGNEFYDVLLGEAGDDLLSGDAYNDTLDGGDGADTLLGGVDNDSLIGGAGGDALYGGDGNDQLDGGIGFDTLSGEGGFDQIIIDSARLAGFGASNAGRDLATGGAQRDVFVLSDTVVTGALNLAAGQFSRVTDFVASGADADQIALTATSYSSGPVGPPRVFRGEWSGGSLTLGAVFNTGLEVAAIVVLTLRDTAANTTYVIADNDRNGVLSHLDAVVAFDGAPALTLANFVFTSFASATFGTSGNDSIGPSGYSSYIFGEAGNDTITGDLGLDYLVGGIGNDRLFGSENNDTLFGGAGDDWLDGGGASDTLVGSDGADTLIGGTGFDAGLGVDVADFSRTSLGVFFDYAAVNGTAPAQFGGSTLSGIEEIKFGTGNDTIIGRATGERLSAGNGNNYVYAGAGNDWIEAGQGNDIIAAGGGNDTISSGVDDLVTFIIGPSTELDYVYAGAGDDSIVNGGLGVDVLLGESGNDTISDAGGMFTYLFGGTGFNDLISSAAVNVFMSEGTSDFMYGDNASYYYRLAAGESYVSGGDGVDQFIGGSLASNDIFDGGAGTDYAYGGKGNDFLYGGLDNDVLIGQSGDDTLDGGGGINLLWANDAGSDQILVYVSDGGTQVVDFFEAGGTNDVVRLVGSSLSSFAGIQSLINNIGVAQGANLMVNAGSGAQLYLNLGANQTAIWFQGVSAYSLTSADFLFA